jgi:UDP-GlcNAc:undecaprenyl-phosphate GlcNAc-1-phosphate transferase
MVTLFAFLSALALSYAGTRLLLRRPPASAFVDVPSARSSHDQPKPRFGGIAIVAAFFLTYAWLCVVRPELRAFLPMAGGCAVLFGVGLWDDWRGIGVGARFVAQGLAAAIAIGAGVVIDTVTLPVVGTLELGWLAVPLTALVFVTSVNFYNFIDGIDGLAAGSALISSAFLAIVAYMVGQPMFAALLFAVAGAALGFLQYNFPPSRLFMGDGGSTFFGYVFAYLAVAGNQARPEIPIFVPVLLLSSLYLDAGLTVVNRLVRREKLFQPHRTHYYQRLLQIGLNHKQVTLLEYLVTILLGASALLYVRAGEWFAPFLGVAWMAAFTLAILKIRGLERGDRLVWERRTLFVITTDLAAIAVAYLGAYFLRMGFQFTEAEGRAVLRALPIVIIVRSACFYKFGLYRSMWRYTTTSDVVRVIKAVSVGSAIILAAVVLLYRFVAFPRALFLIEYFLLISLILGVRFSTRLFHEIGREAQGGDARRFAVIGSGDAAERAARELNARGPGHSVVCFVDDDAATIGLTIHGVPVAGPGDHLADICARFSVDALVYARADSGDASASLWVARARSAGVPVLPAPGAVDDAVPAAIALDRVASELGQRGALSPRAVDALKGRTVLVTHAGTGMGGAVVGALREAGAEVVVHVDDPALAREGIPAGVSVCAGPLADDAFGVVASVKPDLVVHAVNVARAGVINDDDFSWHHLVRETESLARASWKARPGSRVVLASRWEGTRPGDRQAAIAAVMEATLLSRMGTNSAAVLRLPRVLTADLLSRAPSGVLFDIAAPEAARCLVEIAAGAFRGIYATAPGRERSLSPARGGGADARLLPAAGPPGRLTVFPSEHVDECGVEGVRRVLGPLFPAAEPFRRLAAAGPIQASHAEREEWLRAIAAQLYHVSVRSEAVFDRPSA